MAINTITGNTLLESGFFPPVRAASTGSPLTPSTGGLLTVDGIALVAGDRVLCKDETSAVNNGIYAANTGPWVRTSDASSNQQFFSGMGVVCALGTVNAKKIFLCTTTDDPVVVGTSLITWAAQLPVGAGNVVGPGSSTTGDVAIFADATGKLLADVGVTGTGPVVKGDNPVLVAPALGAATATTVNNVAITTPLSTATLTIASGKTLTIDNTLELAGTDGKKFTFPAASDTVVTLAATQTLTNKTLTNPVIPIVSGSSGATGTLATGANSGTGGQLTLFGSTSGSAIIAVSNTGSPQYGGTATNDNAPAGNIGEYATSNCPSPSSTATVTITIAAPGVITWTAHPFSNTAPHVDAAPVVLTTSGALPTGLTAGTVYYVVPSSITVNTFTVATTVANALAGTAITTTGTQSGTQTATAGAALASGVPINITGLSLTAGDWDVWGTVYGIDTNASTVNSGIQASISLTTATIDLSNGRLGFVSGFGTTNTWPANSPGTVTAGPVRMSLSGTTTVFLVVNASFTTSTFSGYGIIQARRAR